MKLVDLLKYDLKIYVAKELTEEKKLRVISKITAHLSSLPVTALKSRHAHRIETLLKHIAIYSARRVTDCHPVAISNYFNISRTGVYSAVKKIHNLRRTNKFIAQYVEDVESNYKEYERTHKESVGKISKLS